MNEKGSLQDLVAPRKGYGIFLAAFFLVTQMAGAGFLSLPRAMADSGWMGLAMILLFCLSVGFVAIRLGRCWVTIEKVHPEEYQGTTQSPYMEISEKILGPTGRKVTSVCLLITLGGSGVVFIVLIAEMLNALLPELSLCGWLIIMAILLTPCTWLGTPKDFWQASVFALTTTTLCVIIIVVKIIYDYGGGRNYPPAEHTIPTFQTFAMGFGAILFAYGGGSVFPTIQNDMEDRTQFWKSIIIAFSCILSLYLPVALAGYILIGDDVDSNILLSLKPDVWVTIAMILEICNLLATFLVSFNPLAQAIEDMLNIPAKFGLRRVMVRSCIVCLQLLTGLLIPDFGLILNLLGGSTIMCLSFLFPPLIYLKAYGNKLYRSYMEWTIVGWERTYLWEIIIVGLVGGLAATLVALIAILNPDNWGSSCFVNFDGEES